MVAGPLQHCHLPECRTTTRGQAAAVSILFRGRARGRGELQGETAKKSRVPTETGKAAPHVAYDVG